MGFGSYLQAPEPLPQASMALTTFMLSSSATSPKTTWRPSSHEVTTVVMKNWEPLLQERLDVSHFAHHRTMCSN